MKIIILIFLSAWAVLILASAISDVYTKWKVWKGEENK